MNVYQGCITLVGAKKTRLLGRFQSEADYIALLERADQYTTLIAVGVYGVVAGKELSREMSISRAIAIS